MNCERARELFSDFLEGSMDAALAAVIRDHLEKCPDCTREFESFKVTWSMLCVLREIEPPRDLRHDVVMRAVRLQQERAEAVRRRSTFGINWDQFVSSIIPMRPVAVAVAAAALVFLVLRFPQQAYHEFTGMFNPKASVTQGAPSKGQTPADSSPMQTSGRSTEAWISRQIGRNTVWVAVTPKQNDDGNGFYSVQISINGPAFLSGDVSKRLPVRVYQLPSNQFDFSQLDSGSATFTGDILEDRPVEVPCLMDESNLRAGTTNLLVVWEFSHRRFGYIVFVPTHKAARPGEMPGFSVSGRDYARSESGLYAALQGMAEDYGVPIVSNAYLTGRPSVINLGRVNLKTALDQTLKSSSLDWVYTDDAVYVDRR